MILTELETLIVGLVALYLGECLCSKIKLLARLNIPAPVIGGIFAAIIVFSIKTITGVDLIFASAIRDLLILVFFLSLGFTAKISSLKSGGTAVLILSLVTVLLLCIQNILGIAVAIFYDQHPFYGLLAGSVAFVGGPGTALAWAKEGQALGLDKSELVAVSAATFAVALGALISAPVTGWIVEKHKLRSGTDESGAKKTSVRVVNKEPASLSLFMRKILLIALSVWSGQQLQFFSQKINILLPGFLCCLIVGMLVANISDLLKLNFPLPVTEKAGEMSLQLFLAISLMGLRITDLGDIILPLLTIVLLQISASIAVAYFILFRVLGKNYDAAVATGGFLGYAISSMPVAMATMDKITKSYGVSTKAVLWITLTGSFFVDLINAFLVKIFVSFLPYLA